MSIPRNSMLLSLIVVLSMHSCITGPETIDYGSDACHYCQMTIVEKIYGAEMITDKGKVFKFDAAECLIFFRNELDGTEGYQLLTNHFETPGAFIPVEEATFLISENLPSPMGAFLTAFKTEAKAMEVKNDKGGELYNWEEVQANLIFGDVIH